MGNSFLSLIEDLEKVYGKANSTGFGSAVFHEAVNAADSIDTVALKHYKAFIGSKWTSETEQVWQSAWQKVYERNKTAKADVLTELYNITDTDAKIAVPLLTDLIENASQGKQALAAAFNLPDVTAMAVFTIGDKAALSGILAIAIYTNEYACSVLALMD